MVGCVCLTYPAWDGANWGSYTIGYHVRYNNSVWKFINTNHTWIAPDHTGNGAISWEWVKDCEPL